MNNLVAAAAAMENDSQFDGGFHSEAGNVALGVASVAIPQADSAGAAAPSKQTKRRKTADGKDISAAKARRLEQNRRAASESRRRKKVMAEELQRSVAFYTKANASLQIHNRDLEHRLILAKQRVQEMGLSPSGVAGSVDQQLPPPEVDSKSSKDEVVTHLTSIPGDLSEEKVVSEDSKSAAVPIASSLKQKSEVGAVHPSQDKPSSSLDESQNSNTIAAENSMASTHQLSGSATTKDGSEDEYIEALKQFAAQQSAIASAAAASANAAYQAIKYHEMMKKNGHSYSTNQFPMSQFFMSGTGAQKMDNCPKKST
jgi:hypothetical protein